jgi:hypothetical protein
MCTEWMPTRPALPGEGLRGHHAPAIVFSGIRSARPHGRWPVACQNSNRPPAASESRWCLPAPDRCVRAPELGRISPARRRSGTSPGTESRRCPRCGRGPRAVLERPRQFRRRGRSPGRRATAHVVVGVGEILQCRLGDAGRGGQVDLAHDEGQADVLRRHEQAPQRRSSRRGRLAPRSDRSGGRWLPRARSRGRSARRDSPAGSQRDSGRNRRRDRFCEGGHRRPRAANVALFVLHRWLWAHFSVALTDRPRARSLPRRSAIAVASASSDIGVAVMTVFR